MFAVTLAGPARSGVGRSDGHRDGRDRGSRRRMVVRGRARRSGIIPKVVGDRVDPYDAYRDQFAPTWRAEGSARNTALILGLDCSAPAGRRPSTARSGGRAGGDRSRRTGDPGHARRWLPLAALATVSDGGVLGLPRRWRGSRLVSDPAEFHADGPWSRVSSISAGLTHWSLGSSSIGTSINSDNYRYLVTDPGPLVDRASAGCSYEGLGDGDLGGLASTGLVGLA